MQSKSSQLVALLLVATCFQVNADLLATLPGQWQQQLKTVEQFDATLLKPGVGEDIAAARKKVDALLKQPETEARRLASAYGKLGNLYLTHGLYTSADLCYENAIKLAPEQFSWRYYSGYLNQENGNMEAALARFEQAMAIDPDYLPARYRLAQVHLELNRLDQAYSLFEMLLNNTELAAAAHYSLGQIDQIRQDHDEAIQHLTRALDLAPDATSIHYPLALSLRAAGNTELAKKHLKQYKKHDLEIDDPLVKSLDALKDPGNRHFVEAMTAVIRKNFQGAIKEFEAGLAYNPENTAARTSYARVLYLTGDTDKSRQELDLIISQDPEKIIALFLLALLDDETNNKSSAVKLYKRVIALDATHEGANFFLGNHYMRIKDYNSAIKHYNIVISRNEKNIPAQLFKLVALMSSNASDKDLLAATRKITSRAPNLISVKRIQILLLALSPDKNVRDSRLSLGLAEDLYKSHQHPANLELLALTTASAGDFKLATDLMQQALAAESKYRKMQNSNRMKESLLLFENGQLPELDWREEISHMLPPQTKALATFRDYPDANPI